MFICVYTIYEKFNLIYSDKNIPISSRHKYKFKLIEQIRKFFRRVRLKIFVFTEKDNQCIENFKETYGFKSRFAPKLSNKMKEFENDMLNLAKNLKYRRINDEFQKKRGRQKKRIKTKSNKTTNCYRIPKVITIECY